MITCPLFQKWVSWNVAANAALPGWARRHAQMCPACRQFHRSTLLTVQALSVGAGDERRPPPPFLRGKIMSAIRAGENREPQLPRGRWVWAIAVGTACVLLFAGVIRLNRPMTRPETGPRSPAVPDELALNLPSAAQVTGWTKTLDQPLENEMQLVLNDAQTAIKSLQQSFLPENTAGPSPGQN